MNDPAEAFRKFAEAAKPRPGEAAAHMRKVGADVKEACETASRALKRFAETWMESERRAR